MANYESPTVTELGSVQNLTLTNSFNKSGSGTDAIYIGGTLVESGPGGTISPGS